MDIAQLTKALQKAHITLLSNEETRFYSSAVLLGRSEVVEHVSTACTNGVDKLYGYEFMRTKTQAEVTGVALHENLHIMLKHMLRFGGLMSKDAQTANAAMDYVVNGIIYQIKGYGSWISLPQPHLYDAKFAGWSVNEVYEFLTKGRKPDGEQEGQPVRVPSPSPSPAGGQQGGDTGNTSSDEDENGDGEAEDDDGVEQEPPQASAVIIKGRKYSLETQDEHVEVERTDQQVEELEAQITEAIQQATALAGVLGMNLPRVFIDAGKPEVHWKEETAQFFTEFTRGTEEYSWRRYNRRRMVDDDLFPSRFDERIKEVIFAVDASGSMYGDLFNKAVEGVLDAVEALDPETVRVVFWDTSICSDQVFADDYKGLRDHLKPRGGGGTRAACVVEHIESNGYNPTCVVVITDGYLEHDLKWETTIPTLWLVLESEQFVPPAGRKVKVKE
jgi:predicted metal-dependent peptidase